MAVTPSITVSASDLHLSGAGVPQAVGSGEVASLLGLAYTAAGIVAVLVIIIGGVRYAASNGNASQVEAAKNMVLYAVVGLVVVIMAAAITQFVIQSVTK
jgi:TRAP-type C4-dicarboxylate transport system permease small subunit